VSVEPTRNSLYQKMSCAPENEIQGNCGSHRAVAGFLFLGVMTIYVAVLRGKVEIYDSQAMMSVTMNLVNHGSLKSLGAGYSRVHTIWSPYGFGMSLLAVPSYALSLWIGHFGVLASLVPALLMACTTVLIYRISISLSWRALYGLFAALSFGVLSMALWYSTEILSEPGVALCNVGIVYGMVRWRQGHSLAPLWVGVSAAFAIQVRTDSILTVCIALVAIPLFVPWRQLRQIRTIGLFLAPLVASLFFLAWYNDLRFGRLFVSTYGGGSFKSPVLSGIGGLLFSPGRSLFLFNPLTIAGVVGLLLILCGPKVLRDRPLGVLCALLVIPRLLLFSKYTFWDSGSVWGPRYLMPTVPVLSLTIVPLFRATDLRRIWGGAVRLALLILAVVAAGVSYLSVRVPLGDWLTAIESPAWQAQLGIHGVNGVVTADERGHALDFQWRSSEIWGLVTLLRRHLATPNGALWLYGHGTVGYILVGVGLALLGCALFLASMARPFVVVESAPTQ
jgi:hypothetical protein